MNIQTLLDEFASEGSSVLKLIRRIEAIETVALPVLATVAPSVTPIIAEATTAAEAVAKVAAHFNDKTKPAAPAAAA